MSLTYRAYGEKRKDEMTIKDLLSLYCGIVEDVIEVRVSNDIYAFTLTTAKEAMYTAPLFMRPVKSFMVVGTGNVLVIEAE